MNKIFKVIYSKTKHCYVVVSELAKSHCKTAGSHTARNKTALTAAVLLALGAFSFTGMPVAQADADAHNNDFIGANDYYWYWDAKAKKWEQQTYRDALIGHLPRKNLPNNEGAGAKETGSVAAGLYAQAGMQTVTIGNRNAGQSRGSVFIGEHSGYDDKASNVPKGSSNNYVTSVGFQSDATGWGSIAIGSNATAETTKKTDTAVTMTGNTDEDKKNGIYEIEKNPTIDGASVALGYGAHSKDGNIAIGAYSEATTDLSADTSDKAKSYLTGKTATSYVSVGNKEKQLQRRITNVADGAADSDVATIGQLKKMSEKAGVYNEGWGIKIGDYTKKDANGTETTVKNAISVDRNLGTNLDTTGHVHLDVSKTGLVLGTVVDGAPGTDVDLHYGATGDYAVTVGGGANTASGKASVVIGGSGNTASDEAAVSSGGSSNVASGSMAAVYGGFDNEASGTYASIFAGAQNKASNMWTTVGGGALNEASGIYASVWGGSGNKATDNSAAVYGGLGNSAYGPYSAVLGGGSNKAGGAAVVSGGASNEAAGVESAVLGGVGNIVTGANATAVGGAKGSVNGVGSVGILGGSTGINAPFTLAAGYQSTVTDTGVTSTPITEEEAEKFQEEGTHPGLLVGSNDPNNLSFKILDHFATAVGYQATADEAQTVAFGHDKGDTYYGTTTYKWKQKATVKNGHYYDEYGSEIGEDSYKSLMNADGTWNDYSQPIATVEEKKYDSAYYNRLVKVADGIDDHDVVVMEQLKQYAEKNASNIGNNIKVYKTDANGNVQLDKDKKPIEDKDATTTAKNGSKDDWGKALGAAPFTAGTSDKATDASTSDQMVTGKTLYNYDKPTGSQNYVNVNNTTGQNLSALDAQVKANADELDKPNHNIKFYAVDDKILKYLPKVGTYSNNEANDGAKGMGSMAAGVFTHSDGIASTVAGSYSGVLNQDPAGINDLRGAAALSYGTFNVNQNTDATKVHSGVANSIIGQVNMTKNSNAAIIYGAGNIVTDSYRPIDETKAAAILGSVNDPAKLGEAMKDAVKTSGGQVMVMGGGNTVDKAYMSQVVGVGNTVKGNQVQNTKSEWVTDISDTAIKDYDAEKSSQYNYVDGFNNEVINGKHDYVIGANNKLSGDSYDDSNVLPIKRSNKSNIVIGDNHTLTREQNTVIIGSSDTENTQTKARDAVIIGHNANATNDKEDANADNAVAIGRSAKATGGNAVTIGVNTSAGAESITIGSESSADPGSNIAIGRSVQVYGYKITNAVALGVNTKALVSDGVAIGSESQATVKGNSAEGYDPVTGKDSTDKTATWKATKAAVSIGTADGKVTRQINGLAAGTKDTDAVNVAQLKSLQSGLTNDLTNKGLTFAANSGKAYTAKLGDTVTIQGTAKKENHEYTADNLTTEIDKDGNITILMDKDMSVEKLAVNGKDGKDGQPGTPGSIGINGKDGEAGIGIDGKDGISIKGRDGKDGVTMKAVDGKDGTEGHIGLTGPAGTNGKDGTNAIDITVKNGYDDVAKGINGTNGVDGKDGITRIVYTDKTGEHQVATMEDGLKFKGDDTTVIAKKLNNTMEIIGGAKGDLTDGNIGVNSTDKGQLKVQLAKDLTGITSISNQTTTKVDGKDVTTGAKITLGDDGSVDVNGGKITNVDSGADASGNYTTKTNAANIGDVQKIVKDAVNSASDTTNKALAGKANIDASNIGANLKDANGKAASTEDQKTNAEEWGSAIGTGKIEANDGRMVTGKTVYDEVRPKNDGSYVKKNQTTGENLSALDSKIGKLDETKKYNYIDSGKDVSISDNLTKLDTQVKNNATDIQNITNNVQNLSDNAVQYDKDTNKTKVTLGGGKDGTTITNVKDGALNDNSTDAVNGRQLNAVQKQVTNNTNEIIKIKNGEGFTDAGKTVIKKLSQDAVQIKAGTAITIDSKVDENTGNKTYTISANNNGTVAKGDGNLISGDTLYKEVHVDQDGSYIRSGNTVGQNLSALDSGLKTTSDLIHTNTKGDTIQIGGNSTATKIDVSGKDKDGNTTGRVITGIVTDGKDLTSAANVGYVNGITSANTQQIYRDMNNAYSRLDTNINRAAAGSNALAALHPLDFDPADKASFAVGYGHYHNANAAAIGAFYQPNANTMVNMGISLGNGDPGFNAGVSFKLGKGSAYNGVSKAEMAQTIHDQAEEISAIKANDAAKDKRIDALEKENQEMKKQIQEILSRLNG